MNRSSRGADPDALDNRRDSAAGEAVLSDLVAPRDSEADDGLMAMLVRSSAAAGDATLSDLDTPRDSAAGDCVFVSLTMLRVAEAGDAVLPVASGDSEVSGIFVSGFLKIWVSADGESSSYVNIGLDRFPLKFSTTQQ